MRNKWLVAGKVLVVMVGAVLLLVSCATASIPSLSDSSNVTRYAAEEIGLEILYNYHDNPDSNNSHRYELSSVGDGSLRVTGTADFGEGFRTSFPLPLEVGTAFYYTVTVESGVAAPAGSEHTGFVDFFIVGDPDNVMPSQGSLLIRYEYWLDAELTIISSFTWDGNDFTLRTSDFIDENIQLEGKTLSFIVYYDRSAAAWAYKVEGDVEFSGQFDYGVSPQAFKNGAYLIIGGDRIARSPDSIVLHEVGTIN